MNASSAERLVIGLPTFLKSRLEGRLPVSAGICWFDSAEDALAKAAEFDIGWFDFADQAGPAALYAKATRLRWATTVGAGIDHIPFDLLRARGTRLTNGAGLNATAVADYAVMGVLVAAKRFDQVVRAHDRAEWLDQSPGRIELHGSRALIIGYGSIGREIAHRLKAFGVIVDGVRGRPTPGSGELGPDQWQARTGDYDFIIVAAPATADTAALVDAEVIAAMKPTAWLVNIARGPLIAREPLLDALRRRAIGGAFLDVTDPEPLSPDDPLWKMPDAIVTMHLSGRSQTGLYDRGIALFLANYERFVRGEPMVNEIDFEKGY